MSTGKAMDQNIFSPSHPAVDLVIDFDHSTFLFFILIIVVILISRLYYRLLWSLSKYIIVVNFTPSSFHCWISTMYERNWKNFENYLEFIFNFYVNAVQVRNLSSRKSISGRRKSTIAWSCDDQSQSQHYLRYYVLSPIKGELKSFLVFPLIFWIFFSKLFFI